MKPNSRQKSKTKKVITKIWIAILILIIAVFSLFLFSEKVYKIGIVDNVKNILTGQTTKAVVKNENLNNDSDEVTQTNSEDTENPNGGISTVTEGETLNTTPRTGTAPSDEYTKWDYTLNNTNNTIKLKSYTSDVPEVVVYGSYEVNGKVYKTDLSNLKFNSGYLQYKDNETITSIVFNDDIDTSNVTDMSDMFVGCSSLTSLDLGNNFDTSNVTDMSYMFNGCSSLTSLDLGDKFDTSKVTDMSYMFSCGILDDDFSSTSSLTILDLGDKFDTRNVKNMSYMFDGCSSLTSLDLGDKFDTSKVTNMMMMFDGCSSLTSLDLGDKFDTSNVENMCGMFHGCSSLTSLDLGDKFYTYKVLSMSWMFANCNSLTSLNLGNTFYTNKVTDMSWMFAGCGLLTSLDLGNNFDTSNVADMSYMFASCSSLTNLNLGDKFDTSSIGNMYQNSWGDEDYGSMYYMFDYCNENLSVTYSATQENAKYAVLLVPEGYDYWYDQYGNKRYTDESITYDRITLTLIPPRAEDSLDQFLINKKVEGIDSIPEKYNMKITFNRNGNLEVLNLNSNSKALYKNKSGKEWNWSEGVKYKYVPKNLSLVENGINIETNKVTINLTGQNSLGERVDVTIEEYGFNTPGYTLTDVLVERLDDSLQTTITNKYTKNTNNPKVIEYYYDNTIDDSKTENLENTEITNELINSKIPANIKDAEKYMYQKVLTEGITTKIYYVSKETPVEPEKPTDPETGKRLYTITINNDKTGHRYNSYQVFEGDFYYDENKRALLSNIEWGKNFKEHEETILAALKERNNEKYKDCTSAEEVANVIKGEAKDSELAREFTIVIGKFIEENEISVTKGTKSPIQQINPATGAVEKTYYQIPELEAGYYIVLDAETEEKDDAYSRYLIDVVQDVTMNVKTSIPTLTKKVEGNNIKNLVEGTGTSEENPAQYTKDETHNTAMYKAPSKDYTPADYDIKFELSSYIPGETENYSKYEFELVDILDKGFDYDNNSLKITVGGRAYPLTRDVVVKGEEGTPDTTQTLTNYTPNNIKIDSTNYETYKKYFEEDGQTYPEGYAESNYGKTLIIIRVEDLIEQIKEKYVVKAEDFIVTYNAKLNGKGEVGNTPNVNQAYLKFSNDPYHADKTTQTKTVSTYTYTIDLNLSKIAEIKKSNNTNNNTINTENAVEGQITEGGATTENSGNEGTTGNTTPDLTYLAGAEFEIYKEELLENNKTNKKLITTLKTDEILDAEGNIINEAGHAIYSSLDAGTYYIKETKAPEGYNKLREEIKLEIKATTDELGAITWTVEASSNKLVQAKIELKEIKKENVNEETGETTQEVVKRIPEVKLQVENTSGFQLPATGGVGTIIFTVAGLSLMVIAVISLKLNKKKIK